MKRVWLSLLLLLGCSSWMFGQEYERLSDYEESLYGKSLHLNGSYDALSQVRSFWTQEYRRLNNDRYAMSLCGNGESILKVTIPSSMIFEANESQFLPVLADGMLRPFLRLLRGEEAVATVVVACYSDNNGSERYLDEITSSRANAISQWLGKQGVTSKVACYGIGGRVALNDNNTIDERAQNRRVSLYLVPNKRMMKLAKKQKLVNN